MNASKVEIMDWPKYVARIAGGDTQAAIGHKIGVSGATISRWSTFAPKPENVAAFARAYNRPVLEAFVAAGFLTADEANVRPVIRPDLKRFSIGQMFRELELRLAEEGLLNSPESPYDVDKYPIEDLDDPAHYGKFGLAAHPPMETEHEKYERLHGDRGEENQDPDH